MPTNLFNPPPTMLNLQGLTGATGPIAPFGFPVGSAGGATPSPVQPFTPPISQPVGQSGGQTSPVTPVTPFSIPTSVQGGGQGTSTQSQTTPQTTSLTSDQSQTGLLNTTPTQSNPFGLSQAMGIIQNQITNNNQLVTAKNLVLKQLYDVPLSDADKAQLQQTSPGLAAALQSGDRNLIDFNLRLLNDQIAGRTNTLDQSVQTLTTGYNTAVQQAETQQQDALNTVLNYAKANGQKPGVIFRTLYPALAAQYPQLGAQLDAIAAPYGAYIPAAGGTTSYAPNDPTRIVQNNNPTAFTTDVAQAMGLVQGVDYIQGTPFTTSTGQTLYTANLLGDPVATTIKGLDQAGFYTASGQPRWSYVPQLNQDIINNWANASEADKESVVQQMYQFEGGQGQLGAPQVTASPPPPDATANKVDPITGMTPNAIYNDAIEYMFTGKTPSLGLGSAAQTKAARFAIQNKAGAIASAAGNTFPQLQALYKANSAAATQNVERLARVESVLNATQLNFPRLEQLADQVKAEGIDITEADVQAGSAAVLSKFGSSTAASYVELLNTIRSDYSAAQASLAGSRGGQFFASNAQDAIPIGLTSTQYDAIKNTLVTSSNNAVQATNDEVNSLLGVTGGITNQGVTPSTSSQSQTTPSGFTYTISP